MDVTNLNSQNRFPNLSSLSLKGPGVTVTGQISGLPASLRELELHGFNTVGGVLSTIPPNIKYFNVWGNNQLSGDIITIPNNIEYFICAHSGSNLYGNVSALSAKPNLKYFEYSNNSAAQPDKIFGSLETLGSTITGFLLLGSTNKFAVSGDIGGLPPTLQFLQIGSGNIGGLTGNIVNIPSNSQLYFFDVQDDTSISGDVSKLPSKLVWLRTLGTNTLSGNIATIPNLSAYYNITLYGDNTVSGNIDSLKNCNNLGIGTTPDTEWGFNVRGDNTLVGSLSAIKNLSNLKVFHVISEFSSVSGDISHLPSDMRNFILSINLSSSNTLTGDVANLPSKIRTFQQRGGGSITGDIGSIPETCTSFTCRESFYNSDYRSLNTLYGNVKDMPRSMAFWISYSDSSDPTKFITGDIKDLPRTLINLRCVHYKNYYNLFGDIKDMPVNMDYIDVRDVNTITGHLSSLQAANNQIRIFYVLGNNTITGDTSYFPVPTSTGAGFIQIAGNNTISGSLCAIPPQVDWVSIKGNNSKVNKYYDGTEGRGYFKRIWRNPMRTIEVAPGLTACQPFPQEHLVTLLTDLTSVSAWGYTESSREGVIAQSNCEAVFTSLYPEVTAAIQRNLANGCPAITINGPITATPTFYRNFARYKTLNHGDSLSGTSITFTRASSATYFDSNGVMQVANIDEPRFDHDPVTKESKGLLIEETRINHAINSENLSAWTTNWTTNRATITSNAAIAPNGQNTAFKLIENTVSDPHLVGLSGTFMPSVSNEVTWSIFAKAGERKGIRMNIRKGNFVGPRADFNLQNGTITRQDTNTDLPFAQNLGATIQNVGNSWYRCSVTGIADPSSANPINVNVVILNTELETTVYPGDNVSGLFLWGAQLEQGAFPTSYIPTTTLSATRSQDFAVVTPINSFFNSNEGTMVAKAFAPVPGTGTIEQPSPAVHRRIVNIGDGVTINGNHFSIGRGGNDDTRATIAGPGIPDGLIYIDKTFIEELDYQRKVSYSYKLNSPYIVGAGGTVTTGAVLSALPVVNTMTIGSDLSSWSGTIVAVTNRYLNGHVSNIMYIPTYFTSTQIQQISI